MVPRVGVTGSSGPEPMDQGQHIRRPSCAVDSVDSIALSLISPKPYTLSPKP